jgi:DNA-binding NarL/FixJ family response regulator
MVHRDEWRHVLSLREFEVALLAAEGASNKQIARQLGLSEGTVKLHVNNIFRKVGARSRYDLIKLGVTPNAAVQSATASRQSHQVKPQRRRP